MNLHRVSITEARRLAVAALASNNNILFVGPPGVGKTAVMGDIAHAAEKPLVPVLGSSLDPTDIGGFPVVRPSGQFDRIPMAAIRRCADEPCLLFLDEVSCVSKPVLATLLRLVHDRVAGDIRLHPDTRIVGACNPADQAPGAAELEAAFLNRWAVYAFYPTIAPDATGAGDVFSWFSNTLGTDENEHVARWARDFAAILTYRPDLVQLDPPQAAITSGDSWGSPRAWERGLRMAAAVAEADQHAALAGSVGPQKAAAFLTTLALQDKLPSVQEVLQNPQKAQLPRNRGHQIGALAILMEVGRHDVWPAWIYASRLSNEVQQAAARMLHYSKCRIGPSPFAKAGTKCKSELMVNITRTVYTDE